MQTWGDALSTKRPSRMPKVQDFLVCKSWFQSAAAAWIRVQSIVSLYIPLATGIFASFAQDVDMEWVSPHEVGVLQDYRSLRYLQVTIAAHRFSAEARCPWISKLTAEDFSKVDIMPSIIALRGLKQFKVSRSSYICRGLKTRAEETLWKENLEALESYVNSFVLAPKDDPSVRASTMVEDGPKPLYLGSRVCQGTSRLLPVDFYLRYGEPFDVARRPELEPITLCEGLLLPRPSPSREKSDADHGLPETAHELVDMLGMTPQQIWRWTQKAKDIGAGPDI